MSFKPKGASLPARFKRSNDNQNFRQYPRSRLVVVDSYDLANKTMRVTQVSDGRKFQVYINPEKVALGTQSTVKYNGNSIDEKMSLSIPVGSRCALEATKVEKKIKIGNEDVSVLVANWVRNVKSQEPHKSFAGWFSVSSYDNRIVSIQYANPEYRKAIRPSTDEGVKELEELCAKMDNILEQYKREEYPINLGVCFRTMVKIDERKNQNGELVPVYQVVDTTPPFDWQSDEVDAEGRVIQEGSPLSGSYVEDQLSKYFDYVYGSEDQSSPEAYPGLVASGVISPDQKPVIEVEVYSSYVASRMNDRLDISNVRNPLYSLANVMTKYSLNDEQGYVGKNWMVDGVVILSDDKAPETKGGEWKNRNIVVDLLIDGPRKNSHTIYEAADGGIVEVHPGLDRVLEPRELAAKNDSKPSASNEEDVPTLSAVNGGVFSEDDTGSSFFAAATQVDEPTPEPAQEKASTPTVTPGARRFNRGG